MPQPLPVSPLLSYGIDATEDINVEEINYGDNYSDSVTRGINPVRQVWNLVWEDITTLQKETLRNFFRNLAGVDYFTWTPTGQVVNLKWKSKQIKSKPTGADLWTVTVTARQVFDA